MKRLTTVGFLTTVRAHSLYLVARPAGVVHAHAGPLTASGRHTSRGWPAVCRTKTRRLTVLEEAPTLLELAQGTRRICGNCTARLAVTSHTNGRAVQLDAAGLRAGLVQQFEGVTEWVLSVWAWLATTTADLTLVRLAVRVTDADTSAPITAPTGRDIGPLVGHLDRATARIARAV